MSFGSSGFGGFGSNNQQNQNQNTGFGGFGSNTNNTTGGFGSTGTNPGFGANNTSNAGGSLFGGGSTTGGFGSGGFGASTSTSSPFGAAKPAFGAPATSAAPLFGGSNTATTASTGFGGFGSGTNTGTGTAFGSSTGGGLFGAQQNKPAFGTGTTGGSMFGGGGTTSGTTGSGFGGFGSSTGGGFGAQQPAQNQGTAVTPFTAHQEKDAQSNSNSHYQSITFQQPYTNFSFEELRLADYNAGRRYGNSNGQAGAFGQSTGFGGFGQSNTGTTGTTGTTGGFGTSTSTGGGPFGGNANTSSPFGQNQNSNTGGFGSGSGGLFGGAQNKPAGGGLFGGGSTATSTSAPSTTGFGGTSSNAPSTGFGGFGNTTNNAGGGLFGNNNNQNQSQSKPFGGFGASTTGGGFGSSTTGGFGSNTNNQSTPSFGASTGTSNTGGGLFGNNQQQQQQQQQPSGGGLFGGGFGSNQNQQGQNQNQNTSGGLFGGGFGQNQNQNQQKPGGLFGASTSNSGGGLFGGTNNQQQSQTGTGLFGANQNNQNNQNNQQSGGGLFGAKPATGGGLFGGTQANPGTSGGGLFGGSNQNQNQSGGLFGGNNQTQNKPSLFGGSSAGNTGGGLFGGLGNNNQGNFGASQQQQSGGSLFGESQQNQQPAQQQSLTASLNQNPYGNDQLFANLGTASPAVGPLATPLSGAQKPAKRPQMLPAFKINPSASMRLITPQKRGNGYSFSYSTYGTPGSAQSFSSASRGSTLLGSGNVGRSLSKSLSTSNLRTSMSAEDSVLAPGAFTPNHRPYSSSSSVRRLKIDRSLRTDLFGSDAPERPTKRVSFDGTAANGAQANGDREATPNNALVRTETDGAEPSSEELGLVRASKESRTNGSNSRPETEQTRGNELAIVPEDEQVSAPEPRPAARKAAPKPQHDQEPGEYYMIPSIQEVRDMSRDQLKSVAPLVVGRAGIGKIEFDKVDLTAIPIDQIMGGIVKLNVRSATVYESGVNTPPEGRGLNVPSTITLENSWPRSNGGRLPVHERKGSRYDKHIERLKRVGNTEFLSYNPETGEWVFRVQHFTTYGLDDEDETMVETGNVKDGQDTTPTAATPENGSSELSHAAAEDTSMMSPAESELDDTFDFMKGSRKTVPGGFGDQSVYDDDDHMQEDVDHEDTPGDARTSHLDDPFVEGDSSRALISPPDTDTEEEQNVVGAFPRTDMPKSILKPTATGTPTREDFELTDDWADQLQRTVSPRKQDRRALREMQMSVFDNGGIPNTSIFKASTTGQPFNTSMDIMKSLWAQPKNASVRGRGVAPGGKGFEV